MPPTPPKKPPTAPFHEVEMSCLHSSIPEIPFDFARQAGHLDFYMPPSGFKGLTKRL